MSLRPIPSMGMPTERPSGGRWHQWWNPARMWLIPSPPCGLHGISHREDLPHRGVLCSRLNSPLAARALKRSISSADMYWRPAMLRVLIQPNRRQRQHVTEETPASSANLPRATTERFFCILLSSSTDPNTTSSLVHMK